MPSQNSLKGLRVLVVQSEPHVAAMLSDALVNLGCKVVGPAGRLIEAVELLLAEPIDCAFLDIDLGADRIFPLADVLRAKAIPLAFCTADGRQSLREADHAIQVIAKPFGELELARVVRDLARARSA